MPSMAEYLHSFARSLSGNVPQLEKQLRDIEAHKRDIESQLEKAHLALNRANSFIPGSGLEIYCPRCWIMHERRPTLRAAPSNNSHIDLFRCNDCNYEYEVEV